VGYSGRWTLQAHRRPVFQVSKPFATGVRAVTTTTTTLCRRSRPRRQFSVAAALSDKHAVRLLEYCEPKKSWRNNHLDRYSTRGTYIRSVF